MSGAPRRWVAPAALGLALLSLAGNAFLLWQLRHPERWAVPAAARALSRSLDPDATLRHTVRIPAGTPLALDIPVDERFLVRVDTVLPVSTRIRVPVQTPVGEYTATVPIRARVPLRGDVPLRVRHTFQLRTRTTQEIAIPIELRLRDLPLDELLGPARP